jgi:pimeloyl-ACP methyl ester carboxylesterase
VRPGEAPSRLPPGTGLETSSLVRNLRVFLLFATALVGSVLTASAAEPRVPPSPAQRSEWNGFERIDFTLANRPCILVLPHEPAAGRPWIWRMEFFGNEPQADLALLAHGWCLAYMNAQDMYGAPKALALFNQFYAHLVVNAGLSKRVVLEGFSRGGLYAVNFAATHASNIAALYLDAPVLDIRSWPGRNRASKEWRECLAAYGITEAMLPVFKWNPVDQIPALAAGRIPIIAVCGDADMVVPLAENTAVLEKRYRELGGTIQVILKPGGDHHPHSLKDPAPIVDFLVKNAKF